MQWPVGPIVLQRSLGLVGCDMECTSYCSVLHIIAKRANNSEELLVEHLSDYLMMGPVARLRLPRLHFCRDDLDWRRGYARVAL